MIMSVNCLFPVHESLFGEKEKKLKKKLKKKHERTHSFKSNNGITIHTTEKYYPSI